MTAGDYLWLAIGILVWFAVSVDFFITTVALSGSGPLSRRIGIAVLRLIGWSGLVRHRGRLSQAIGPITLLSTAGVWILATLAGWTLVLYSGRSAFTAGDGEPVSTPLRMVSFALSQLSTVGSSPIRPAGPVWEFVAMLAALNGMVLLTLAVSYILSITDIVLSARQTALAVDRAWGIGDRTRRRQAMEALVPSEISTLIRLAAYPLACNFASSYPQTDIALSVLRLVHFWTTAEGGRRQHELDALAAAIEVLTRSAPGSLRDTAALCAAVESWYRSSSVGPLPSWWRPGAATEAGAGAEAGPT